MKTNSKRSLAATRRTQKQLQIVPCTDVSPPDAPTTATPPPAPDAPRRSPRTKPCPITLEDLVRVRGLVGDVVLLPLKPGTKIPSFPSWQKTTLEDTRSGKYQQSLLNSQAVGILLGKASGGLCSIDFDTDAALGQFLAANPKLKPALRTRGRRGANIWVRIVGPYPPNRTLKDAGGNPVGEWRADGNHTVIAGAHKDGGTYRYLVEKEAPVLAYDEIVWPLPPPPFPSSPQSELSAPLPDLGNLLDLGNLNDLRHLHDTSSEAHGTPVAPLAERIGRSERAREALAADARLSALYKRYIETRFTAKQGERNRQVVAMAPFLHRAVSLETARQLMLAFYDVNEEVFHDSRAQHLAEVGEAIRNTSRRWDASLPDWELGMLNQLPNSHLEAYRICRDLAMSESKTPRGEFFLSSGDLGQRLDIDCQSAARILKGFVVEEYLTIVKPGIRRQKGVPGVATYYRWEAPLPDPAPAGHEEGDPSVRPDDNG